MATYISNIATDNSPISVAAGSFSTVGPADVLYMGLTQVQLSDPLLGYADYFGSFGYTYSGGFQYLSWPSSTLTGITTYDLNWNVMDSVSNLSIAGNIYQAFAVANDVPGLVAYIFNGNDTITGSRFNDVLWGYAGNDAINGGGGNDTLNGGGGNDILDGGSGVDRMVGGYGNDLYYVNDARDVVIETSALSIEVDRVISSVSYALTANVENLSLTGLASIKGSGNALANTLKGNAASNVLDGGGGRDIMIGGAGNDTYIVDNAADTVVETSVLSYEIDTVMSGINWTLGANVENLTLTGTAATSGIGNDLNNRLTGNQGNNRLDGGGGDDTLRGGAGDDTLKGGVGDDTLIGGAGNDILIGGAGIDTFSGGAGDDVYYVDDNLPASVLTITGQAGNYLTQGAKNYIYTSAHGTWFGYQLSDGNLDGIVDSLFTNCLYPLNPGQPAHFFLLSVDTNQPGINLVPGTYLNADGGPGRPLLDFGMDGRGYNQPVGSFTINSISIDYSGVTPVLQSLSMTFSESGDIPMEPPLTGTLNYNISASTYGEQVTELANQGTDHVISSVSYVLSDNVENLTLTGTAATSGIGNALNNRLTGNQGNNLLNGGGGDDIVRGGAGDDIVKGDAGDDTLMGGAGNDILVGGAGANTLTGGLGADVFVVDSAATMAAAISDFLSGTDHVGLNAANFGGLFVSGSLDATAFGAADNMVSAATAAMRLFYDQTQGDLYYDSDGNGAAAATKIATFTSPTKPVLAASDFVLAAV